MSKSLAHSLRAAAVSHTAFVFAVAATCALRAFAQGQPDIVATNLHSFTAPVVVLAFSPDSSLLASGEKASTTTGAVKECRFVATISGCPCAKARSAQVAATAKTKAVWLTAAALKL